MKNLFFIVFLFLLETILTCCFQTAKIEISFYNKSEKQIDSVIFKINNYSCKTTSIDAFENVYIKVPVDSVITNSHGVVVLASIYSKGNLLKESYSFSDLGGVPNEKYSLILNGDLSTILK